MRWPGLVLWLAPVIAQAATASLQDESALEAQLRHSPQCCVIDARSEASRKQAALPGALAYGEKLRIEPSSAVVVVADTNARSLQVARILAKTSAHDVYAVKGGLSAWTKVQAQLEAESRKPGSKFSFVIPHNTCEQGAPLQVFEAASSSRRPPVSTPK